MKPQCQATIEDYENGTRNNLVRVIVVPLSRRCTKKATSRFAHLCLCTQHLKLAVDGLIEESGNVAPRGDIRNVRDYPKHHLNGLYPWAKNIKPELL
jgi:hypothetical protein